MQRKIIHIDMDAFFASVEKLDNPAYRDIPIAVGGGEERGVVSAACYLARKYGVRSAMSGRMAKKLCPNITFTPVRYQRYKQISKQIHEIFHRFTDQVEPLALDEAYLDVTENKVNVSSAPLIALNIKELIKKELNLTASAGVSYNKFLAKLASDEDKPNGLFVIEEQDADEYIQNLPIHRFYGIGETTAHKLREIGVIKGKDLLPYSIEQLEAYFGKMGHFLYNIARGIDHRPVEANHIRKSIASETTFDEDIWNHQTLLDAIEQQVEELWSRVTRLRRVGKTVSIKLKFNDFTQITRAKTGLTYVKDMEEAKAIALELTEKLFPLEKPIRLVGVQLSNLNPEEFQLELF